MVFRHGVSSSVGIHFLVVSRTAADESRIEKQPECAAILGFVLYNLHILLEFRFCLVLSISTLL